MHALLQRIQRWRSRVSLDKKLTPYLICVAMATEEEEVGAAVAAVGANFNDDYVDSVIFKGI
jgi:hypothetical protein